MTKAKSPRTLYVLRARVWLYPGAAAWHFLTVPKKASAQIKKSFGEWSRGWGSLPVVVTVSATQWKTSIFPDKKAGAYLLPLKAQVRKQEGIVAGQTIQFSLEFKI